MNVLDKPFEETGTCVPGGLYFSDTENIFGYLNYGVHLRDIELPLEDNDLKMVVDGDKYRANKIILGAKYELANIDTFKYLIRSGAPVNYNVVDWIMGRTMDDKNFEIFKYLILLLKVYQTKIFNC